MKGEIMKLQGLCLEELYFPLSYSLLVFTSMIFVK